MSVLADEGLDFPGDLFGKGDFNGGLLATFKEPFIASFTKWAVLLYWAEEKRHGDKSRALAMLPM